MKINMVAVIIRLVELIDFFDSFPLLFNGERIKPTESK